MNYPQIRTSSTAFALFLATALAPSSVQAQDLLPAMPMSSSVAASPAVPAKKRIPIETSVSLGVAAQLTATRVTDFGQRPGSQSLDPSAAVLGSVRQSFRPWLGYAANLGYTRTTEENAGALSYAAPSYAIPSNVYETSIAYLLQRRITPRLTGFADLGGGMLTFLPVHRGPTAGAYIPPQTALVPSVNFRPLGVAGAGVDYHLNSRLALRAEYRGLLYKYADYGGIAGRQVTVSSQPTISLTYTFNRAARAKRRQSH